MEKSFKRFLSLAMAFLLVLSNVPVQTFATDSDIVCEEHNFVNYVTEATCTAPGVTYQKCSVCGHETDRTESAALGHSFGGAATCSVCGEPNPDYVAPHEHVWGEIYDITATCTEAGEGKQDCSAENCEIKTQIVTVEALGHKWGDTVENTAPGCETVGAGTKTCTVDGCGATEPVEIPALGHSYTDGKCGTCGAPDPVNAVAEAVKTRPDATVTEMDALTLSAGEYSVWDGSDLNEGTEELPLQIVMNFKANDTLEEALAGGYGDWLCDFYLTFDGLKEGSLTANGCYLAGNYGPHGWIAIPTDGLELESGTEYPVVSTVVNGLTYETICDSVKDFTAALYIDPAILEANPDFKVTLKLKMTDPENEAEVLTIGEPAEFTAEDLLGEEAGETLPDATVTEMDALTLATGEYNVWDGSNLTAGTEELPLQAVMNFKALETLEQAKLGGYGKWICDFYLTFDNMEGSSISGNGSYLAGNYGSYGWIAIPTDGMTVEEGVEYPIVTNYDPNLTYENICDYVKEFTAALYVNPETLLANPDMTVTLKLKMTNPEDPEDYLIIGEEAVYTAPELYGKHQPEAEVKVLEPLTLEANGYNVWDGKNLTAGVEDRPLQAVMNFKALETLEQAQLGGYGDWICDFYLTFDGMAGDSIPGIGSYLAGNYGTYGWIVIPTDGLTVEAGVEYPIVTNYDPKLTYENICDYVREFTAALYVNPDTLLANPDMTVTLKLKMTNPENPEDYLIIGEPAVFTVGDLLAACGYVAQNIDTDKFYDDVNDANEEAEAGETVILLKDVNVRMLNVFETFDLNGHVLTATYVTSYGNIVDNSESNAGLLKVDTKFFFAQKSNEQLPVNTPNGYQFVEIRGFNYRYLEADQKYVFQPLFEEYAHGLLLAGYDISGVDIRLNVSWMSGSDSRNQGFSYNDKDFLEGYINSYKPATGKYGKMFTLALNSIPTDLTYQIQLISDNGVTIASETTLVEKTEEDKTTTENITINNNAEANQASALVPEGTKLAENATADSLKLTVAEVDTSESNITLGENEVQKSVDVHIEGIAADNTVPMIITLKEFAPKGQNEGNLSLYHVENGTTNAMTQVFALAEVDAHNEFYYDPATGDVTMALATFSEIAVVSDTTAAWEGNFDYSWYVGKSSTYTIANADQLAAFGAIVGGMDGQTQDSFKDKTINLIADINLGDAEAENDPDLIFYPIGYNSSDGLYNKTGVAVTTGFYAFEGTFNGQGHTISNFYQNTWEMKGDNNYYDATLQYYRDGMGLFGKVYGGTVKNLTVENFKSDGEYTTTGVIAAYADYGASFENIAVVDCNPRVYNIGNGGIVGCVGWYTKEETEKKVTFTNITVDNSNKISALWGSWDVACGGIVGQYYPTSGQSVKNAGIHFENCHVSAIMDVYNDVCANYQYYAYRYTGMMIGSIRENETIDGHVYPKMDGITAYGCTVNFGDWNDYYYCELVANSLASYTHDHQMSRLDQVASVDVESMKVTTLKGDVIDIPADGRVNYVVVKAKDSNGAWIHGDGENYATCYHFVNGVQHKHDVADSDNPNPTETVDGVEGVLKEDKQLVYREFNQLFTGYGWGVTSKGLTDYVGVTTMGIAEGDQEESVEKFTAKNGYQTLKAGEVYKLGDLFAENAEDTAKVAINNATVTVGVTDTNTADGTVTSVYTQNSTDWKESTLTFTGTGNVNIAIQDYHFCKITTLNINVGDKEETSYTDRIQIRLPKYETFLYRVGNTDAFKIGSLFEQTAEGIGAISVEVTDISGKVLNNYSYVAGSTWDAGTIDFVDDFTGVVIVTISDDNFTTPVSLKLEVVKGKNHEDESISSVSGNVVLLRDVELTSNGALTLTNSTLFGNGFTLDATNGAYASSGYLSGNYLIGMKNAKLDNLTVVGKVYTQYGAQAKDDYNRALVYCSVDNANTQKNVIENCYLSNTASPVRVSSGSIEIINTTLKGGNYANLDIRNGNVVLDNVTTINQVNGNDKADDDSIVIGFGVVVYNENVLETTTIEVRNGIIQYNVVSQSQISNYVKDDTAKSFADMIIFGADSLENIRYIDSNNEKWVNMGIVSMHSNVGDAEVTDLDAYGYVEATCGFNGQTGYVHTVELTANDVNSAAPEYESTTQGAIEPTVEYDHSANDNGDMSTNNYCIGDHASVQISMDAGKTVNWDPKVLKISKNGTTIPYSVSMNGMDYTNAASIPFNTVGNYTVQYTYTDPYYYGVDGIATNGKTYTKYVTVSVKVIEATSKLAEFTFGSDGQATEILTIDNAKYVSAMGVEDNNETWADITVGGQTVYYPIIDATLVKATLKNEYTAYFPVFSGVVTITDYLNGPDGEATIYDSSTTSWETPLSEKLKVVKGRYGAATDFKSDWSTISDSALTYSGPTNVFKYASSDPAAEKPTTYNKMLCYASPSGLAARVEYYTLAQYSYTDNTNTTYYYYVGYHMEDKTSSSGGTSPCVTPDTLITLADGSKKRIDAVTDEDQLLVWDYFNGKYAVAPAAIIFDHGYDNNTVIKLNFSDGTEVKVVNLHQFMDADLNKLVDIHGDNVEQYVGHRFVKRDGESYTTVTLTDYAVSEEYVEAYGIISAYHYNILVEDMFSTDFMPEDYDVFNYFEIGENLMFDQQKMQADIEKYGLYTYADFADYLTPEQFDAFNVQYMKIAVGKGTYTYEGILNLIETYLMQ